MPKQGDKIFEALRTDATLGGASIATIDQAELFKHIGVVRKDQTLFDMTIRDYMHLAIDPTIYVDEDEVTAALKCAGASVFIDKFPDGLNTRMGHKGSSLSLTQRVRIQLASFLVARPQPKLVLIEDVASKI